MSADNKAYRVLTDSSIPKAHFEIGEAVNGEKFYETTGINYKAGDVVLSEDITPPLRELASKGKIPALEEIDRSEAEAELADIDRGLWAPEHAVEHQALVQAGKRVLDRETIIELRSEGAADAAASQAAALEAADGAVRTGKDDLTEDGRVAAASDEDYGTAEEALERETQVSPSGVKAVNPFEKKAAAAEGDALKAKPKRKPAAKRS